MITSSLLFFSPGTHPSLNGQSLGRHLTLEEIELLSFYMTAKTLSAGVAAGFREETIRSTLDAELLVEEENAVGTLWEKHNWQRAAFLMFAPARHREHTTARPPTAYRMTQDELCAAIERRTTRFFSNQPVTAETFLRLGVAAQFHLRGKPWFSIYAVVQQVEALPKGLYRLDPGTGAFHCQRQGDAHSELLEVVHGQWWLSGSGFCLFLVLNLDAARTSTSPDGYMDTFLALGQAGQALVRSACLLQLGAWMTPAISESKCAALLGLDVQRQEALYFIKVGVPEQPHGARRSPI